LVTETFLRFATPALQRTEPWWYFVPILVLGALPWSVMMLRRDGGTAGRQVIFLLLWVLVPFVFFSFSQSKRPQYMLPLVPAMGLLVAGTWSESRVKAGSLALGLLGLVLLLGYSLLPSFIKNMTPAIASAIPGTALPLGVLCLSSAVASWWLRSNRSLALIALILPVVSIPLVGGRLLREIGKERSTAELASSLRRSVTDPMEVIAVHTFPPSLPFYLRRSVLLATETGGELTSNYLVRDLKLWMDIPGSPLRPGDWWREAAVDCTRPRIFVIRSSDAEARGFLSSRTSQLAETEKYAAYGPCGVPTLASSKD
jgi:4-amino-4-deoxy-L-arabinose transferase-like glycosyltransferase